MAKKDGPSIQQVRVRNEDGSAILLYVYEDGYQELTIKLTNEMLKFLLEENHGAIDYGTHEILLAEYDPKAELLTTYPTTVQPGSKYFGFGKYASVQRISIENARPIWYSEDDLDDDDGRFEFTQFPTGFVYDPFDGFGLIYMLRFIVEAIEEFPEVVDIRLCRDSETSIKDGIFRLPTAVYEPVRKTLGRTHRSAVNFANEEKRNFLRSELVGPLKSGEEGKPVFRRTAADLKAILGDAINARGRRSRARSTNETAAVRVVRSSAKELIAENREEILELNREIELVTLEDVIAKFEAKLADHKLTEGSWQKFLSNNPFILRLAFGLPAIVFKEQMPVGGVDLDNKGGKLADFVVKSGAIGNLAIVEIKTPKATLLGKKEYRGGIHAPSVGISGAVTQVMDQRYQLQKNITMLLGNSPNTDASTYAIGCIVIAGTTPTVEAQKKSFELYRNNLSGVVVITFDELLEKLKALHEFLVEQPRRPDSDAGPNQEDDEEEYDEDEDLEDDLEADLE